MVRLANIVHRQLENLAANTVGIDAAAIRRIFCYFASSR
jgi:hypothetical protein